MLLLASNLKCLDLSDSHIGIMASGYIQRGSPKHSWKAESKKCAVGRWIFFIKSCTSCGMYISNLTGAILDFRLPVK
jgi:hypothetical protein